MLQCSAVGPDHTNDDPGKSGNVSREVVALKQAWRHGTEKMQRKRAASSWCELIPTTSSEEHFDDIAVQDT